MKLLRKTGGNHRIKSGNERGFSLIELLVVIAIIGVLSSIVLASLNTARNKGSDAAVKSNLANIRAQAEIFYDTYGTYGGSTGNPAACPAYQSGTTPSASTNMFSTDSTIASMTLAAASAGGGTTETRCWSSGTKWFVTAKLKSAGYWCVDSAGASGAKTNQAGVSTDECSDIN